MRCSDRNRVYASGRAVHRTKFRIGESEIEAIAQTGSGMFRQPFEQD